MTKPRKIRKKHFEGFVARDKSGDVYLWRREPRKDEEKGEWVHRSIWAALAFLTDDDLEQGLNPQWEDEKAIKVRLEYFETNEQPYLDFLENNRKAKQNGLHSARIPEPSD